MAFSPDTQVAILHYVNLLTYLNIESYILFWKFFRLEPIMVHIIFKRLIMINDKTLMYV